LPLNPDTTESIYERLKNELKKIPGLTNFTKRSFNEVWTQAFASKQHDLEAKMVANQLSGWVRYAGGPIDQNDLDNLGVENVDAENVNKHMEDQDLDELGALNNIIRDPGSKANGVVTFTTQSSETTIGEGKEIATRPDSDSNYKSYYTTEEKNSPNGTIQVDVGVEAAEIGSEYNVGQYKIQYMPSTISGVEGFENQKAIEDGRDAQSNESYREDIQNVAVEVTGGGTTRGIVGYIEDEVPGSTTAIVEEFPDANPPYADVVVDGGDRQVVLDAIEFAHPSAVRHNLVRPSTYEVGVEATAIGSDLDTSKMEERVNEYLIQSLMSEDIIRLQVANRIMNADKSIRDIEPLRIYMNAETHTYQSGTSIYKLSKWENLDGSGQTSITDGDGNSYEEGTDYEIIDDDGDTKLDSVEWTNSSPSDGTDFYVDYDLLDDLSVGEREKATAGPVTVQEST